MEIDPALKQRLANVNQEHLLAYWSELNDEQRQILLNDLAEIDLDRVTKAYNGIKQELFADPTIPSHFKSNDHVQEEVKQENIDDLMEPVPDSITGSINEATEEQLKNYQQLGTSILVSFFLDYVLFLGFKAISEGRVCVLLLAGGQGTRLGK